MDVKVRLHWHITGGANTTSMLFETGSDESDFITGGTLKFEANKAGTFEFDILPSHSCYSILRRYRDYVSVAINEDDDLIIGEEGSEDSFAYNSVVFYGRILSISMSFNKVKHVTCEGLLANLIDCPAFNDRAHDIGSLNVDENTGTTYVDTVNSDGTHTMEIVHEDLTFSISGDVSQIWRKLGDAYKDLMGRNNISFMDATGISSVQLEKIDNFGGSSVGDFITNELIGAYGGFLKMDYVRNEVDDRIKGNLYWLKDPSMDGYDTATNDQSIEFGINLLDLSAEFSEDSVSNGIVIGWTDEDDKKHWIHRIVNSTVVANQKTEMPIVYGDYLNQPYCAVSVIEVPGKSKEADAINYGRAYANKFCKYNFDEETFDSYTVKAIDQHFINGEEIPEIKLYDQVHLVSQPHEIDKVLTCTSIEYTIDNPIVRSYKLEVFRPKPSSNEKVLSAQIGRSKKKSSGR